MSLEIKDDDRRRDEGAPSRSPAHSKAAMTLEKEGSIATSTPAFAVSIFVHLGVGGLLLFSPRPSVKVSTPQRVNVTIVRINKSGAAEAEPKKEVLKEEAPKPRENKPKKPPSPQELSTRQLKKTPLEHLVKPVSGVSKESLATGGGGVATPIGITQMTGESNNGQAGDEIQPLDNVDLSAEASLIVSSVVTPVYTADAVDAGLEATVIVEVFVDSKGIVTQAELKRKVGYGMDEKILQSARQARFKPRKDAKGLAIEGWTEIRYRLEIPN